MTFYFYVFSQPRKVLSIFCGYLKRGKKIGIVYRLKFAWPSNTPKSKGGCKIHPCVCSGITNTNLGFQSIKSMLIQRKCCRIADPQLLGVAVPPAYRPRGRARNPGSTTPSSATMAHPHGPSSGIATPTSKNLANCGTIPSLRPTTRKGMYNFWLSLAPFTVPFVIQIDAQTVLCRGGEQKK